MERVELAHGYTISRLIKGGWQLAGGHGPIDRPTAISEMFQFVEAGVTTFDCADIYTGVEELIGDFLNQYRRRYGMEAALGLQVHSKFVPDLNTLASLDRQDVERAIDRSLARLGVERIDLVQFHWWDLGIPRFVDVAGYLADLARQGKIRLIGLTNFDLPSARAIVRSGVPIASSQVQYSLIDRRPAEGLSDFCRERSIKLLCYGTLAGGFLSDRYLHAPVPISPLENRSLTKYRLMIDEFGGWDLFQELLAAAAGIARLHRVGIGEVAIRWTLDQPGVAAAIVGARNAAHLARLATVLPIRLTDTDRDRLAAVIARASGPGGDVYALERMAGGRHAAIMRYNLNTANRTASQV